VGHRNQKTGQTLSKAAWHGTPAHLPAIFKNPYEKENSIRHWRRISGADLVQHPRNLEALQDISQRAPSPNL